MVQLCESDNNTAASGDMSELQFVDVQHNPVLENLVLEMKRLTEKFDNMMTECFGLKQQNSELILALGEMKAALASDTKSCEANIDVLLEQQRTEFEKQLAAKDAEMAAKLADKDAEVALKLADKDAEVAAKLADKDAEMAAKLADKDAEMALKLAQKDGEVKKVLKEKEAKMKAEATEREAKMKAEATQSGVTFKTCHLPMSCIVSKKYPTWAADLATKHNYPLIGRKLVSYDRWIFPKFMDESEPGAVFPRDALDVKNMTEKQIGQFWDWYVQWPVVDHHDIHQRRCQVIDWIEGRETFRTKMLKVPFPHK
jgi:uncharacterized protein YgiM (DUF1202 family)